MYRFIKSRLHSLVKHQAAVLEGIRLLRRMSFRIAGEESATAEELAALMAAVFQNTELYRRDAEEISRQISGIEDLREREDLRRLCIETINLVEDQFADGKKV